MTRTDIRTRSVKVRLANLATPVFENAPNFVLWDLENLRFAASVGHQIKSFLQEHGYHGTVEIEAYSAMRGTPAQRVPEKVIAALKKQLDVTHIRIDSEEKQASDDAIQSRIDELLGELSETNQKANVIIVSSDIHFDDYFEKLKVDGHHSFLIYDPASISRGYLQHVTCSCKCLFREFAALPKLKHRG